MASLKNWHSRLSNDTKIIINRPILMHFMTGVENRAGFGLEETRRLQQLADQLTEKPVAADRQTRLFHSWLGRTLEERLVGRRNEVLMGAAIEVTKAVRDEERDGRPIDVEHMSASRRGLLGLAIAEVYEDEMFSDNSVDLIALMERLRGGGGE